jgi:hypothetical protein
VKRKLPFAIISMSLLFNACGGDKTSPEDVQVPDEFIQESSSLREQYLQDIAKVDPNFFYSEEAAFLYVKNFCANYNADESEIMDAIDNVVAPYCDTSLAE